MKLELKHLAPYLPYDLKYASNQNFDIKISKWELKMVEHQIKIINDCKFENDYKPILRPLFDLTEEIEVNGKHFIPCYQWDHSNPEQDTYCDRIINVASDPSSVEYLDYFIVEKLFEWHFDIFGLIDAGLAIDINTVKF